jgi:hypothetical protein
MERKFLLTYHFENMEGMFQQCFQWFFTEKEMMEAIEDKAEILKDFYIIDMLEVYSVRHIKKN